VLGRPAPRLSRSAVHPCRRQRLWHAVCRRSQTEVRHYPRSRQPNRLRGAHRQERPDRETALGAGIAQRSPPSMPALRLREPEATGWARTKDKTRPGPKTSWHWPRDVRSCSFSARSAWRLLLLVRSADQLRSCFRKGATGAAGTVVAWASAAAGGSRVAWASTAAGGATGASRAI